MERIHDALAYIGTCSGVLSWGVNGSLDIVTRAATIICAVNLVISWALKTYARLKAVRDGKKSPEDAAEEFRKEAEKHGKKD